MFKTKDLFKIVKKNKDQLKLENGKIVLDANIIKLGKYIYIRKNDIWMRIPKKKFYKNKTLWIRRVEERYKVIYKVKTAIENNELNKLGVKTVEEANKILEGLTDLGKGNKYSNKYLARGL